MQRATFDIPILLLVYDRPHLARQVFEAVRQRRPRELFVVADGPKRNAPDDASLCDETRRIFEGVDWDCRVHREFAEGNMGCRERVASGITWFFGQVDRGIVLEDDCVPHPSFFDFCEAMLHRYEEDERVMHVSGSNFQHGRRWGDGSYYYSSYPSPWGWASWKRAWALYDLDMKDYRRFVRERRLRGRLSAWWERCFWLGTFQMMHAKLVNTWDHAWTFAVWNHDGVSITPNRNLISNVGFGPDAAHTTRTNPNCIALPVGPIDEPLVHPKRREIAREADRILLKSFLRFYGPRSRARVLRHAWRAARIHGLP